MSVREHRYLSFLLRLWQVKRNGNLEWRASIDNPHTCERRGFASLAALVDYLMEQIHEEHDEDQDKEAPLNT